eukprot:137910-Chlamydomonas_euryale.AAC.1
MCARQHENNWGSVRWAVMYWGWSSCGVSEPTAAPGTLRRIAFWSTPPVTYWTAVTSAICTAGAVVAGRAGWVWCGCVWIDGGGVDRCFHQLRFDQFHTRPRADCFRAPTASTGGPPESPFFRRTCAEASTIYNNPPYTIIHHIQ